MFIETVSSNIIASVGGRDYWCVYWNDISSGVGFCVKFCGLHSPFFFSFCDNANKCWSLISYSCVFKGLHVCTVGFSLES